MKWMHVTKATNNHWSRTQKEKGVPVGLQGPTVSPCAFISVCHYVGSDLVRYTVIIENSFIQHCFSVKLSVRFFLIHALTFPGKTSFYCYWLFLRSVMAHSFFRGQELKECIYILGLKVCRNVLCWQMYPTQQVTLNYQIDEYVESCFSANGYGCQK